METAEPLFLMHLIDGYAFRNAMGIIKSETDLATMVLSPNSIEISFMNRSKCGIHKIVLNTQEFTMYKYNIQDSEGNLVPEYPIAFDTSEMVATTKGIGRRDGVRLYWLEGDNKINVQPIKTSIKDPGRTGALFVKILNIEYFRYDILGAYKSEPNVRIQAKDFAEICGQTNALKCANLEIIGYNNGAVCNGLFSNNTLAFTAKFGSITSGNRNNSSFQNTNDMSDTLNDIRLSESALAAAPVVTLNIIKPEDNMKVRIPNATVKALSKIHNISPQGTMLRFYFSEATPIKIESPVSTYGVYTICLRNMSSQ